MKKLLLSAALTPVLSFAQITLNNTHFPVANDQLVMSTLLDMTVDYTSTGANYTWDFSTVTPTGQRFTNCRPMSEASQLSSIFFGSFAPAAYKASYFSPTTDLPLDQITANFPFTIEDISLFSKSSATALTMVGYEFILNGQGVPAKSDTIETRYPFPLNYGDTWTSRGYTDLDLNPIYDAKWRQHRYRESEVDGWGTVATPYGSFQALRIHHRILESDSLYISFDTTGMWIPLQIPESHEYEWRAVEEKEAVFRVKTSVVLGTEQPTTMEYRDDYNGLGLGEAEAALLEAYPNPATDQLFVLSGSAGAVPFTLVSGTGIAVASGMLSGNETVIDLRGLDAGLYFLRSGNKTCKIVKR